MTLVGAIGVMAGLGSFAVASTPRPPNIVFVLADDLGWGQLTCYGSRYYETPRLDRLVGQGMRFTNAYAAAPVCSPTRASLMTGKYPARLHLTNFLPGRGPSGRRLAPPDFADRLPLEEQTLAELLRGYGYATGHFGKWHLNVDKDYKPGRPGDPGSQGFDEVLTTKKPHVDASSEHGSDWHHVELITNRAIEFFRKHRDKPFFCYVSHNSIHAPEVEKASLVSKYLAKPDADAPENSATQAAMIETLDHSIGSLVRELEELGIAENTVFIFFSDNGRLGPKNGGFLRGSKGDLYEGGVRSPLIVRWPSVVEPGTVCDELVISNDFFPTLAEVASGAPQGDGLDGLSLVELLHNPQASLHRDALYWHFPHYHVSGLGPQGAIRKGRYKLIEWYEKSAYDEPGALELYDLVGDPQEKDNLAEQRPELAAEMLVELRSWKKSVGAQPMRLPDRKRTANY